VRRVVVIVLALIVLAPTLAVAQAYQCRFDRQVRRESCCPAEEGREDRREVRREAVIEAASCCGVIEGTLAIGGERSAAAAGVPVPVPAIVVVAVGAPAEGGLVEVVAHVGAPARAPPDPLFLRHCSFLL
jgi:hypothetical protein